MPELPEVETLRRQLEEVILGQEVFKVEVLDPKLSEAQGVLKGEVRGVEREGKLLAFSIEGGKRVLLSLRMTGRLLWGKDGGKYVRLVIHFPHGRLHLVDPRRFATLSLPDGRSAPLGVDPLEGSLPSFLVQRSEGRRAPVKTLLMDQRHVAGIGNIYASEILYAAGVHPLRPAGSLTAEQWEGVAHAARAILEEAIRLRGTTISDWRDLYGRPGEYQDRLRVYGRKGEPCPRCGTPIERVTLSGRGTYFCPRCQN